jgi:predicted SnoaL-like aldol condensation-catalyzing enzyme
VADGDFVYLQNRKKLPGKKILIQHTFRLNKEGKIDEHWSTSTVVDLETSKNPKALY